MHLRDKMIKAVLWDMDGTIVDTGRKVSEVMVNSFREVTNIELPESTWSSLFGQSVNDFVNSMKSQHGLDDKDIKSVRQHFDSNYIPTLKGIEPLPGAVELCRKLSTSLPQALVTGSTPEQANAVLDTLNLHECFEFILGSGQYSHGKPNPEPYLQAAIRFGFAPASCLVLEDSPSGVTSAKAAGMFTVAIHKGNQGQYKIDHADAEIDSLLDFDMSWVTG